MSGGVPLACLRCALRLQYEVEELRLKVGAEGVRKRGSRASRELLASLSREDWLALMAGEQLHGGSQEGSPVPTCQ